MSSTSFSALPDSIRAIEHGLVVSCQAPPSSPLHEPDIIAAIAQASVNQGAVGVRIDTPAHVRAVRQRVNVPIIGLWKQEFANSSVYITPTIEQADAIATAGADIIAIDATLRPRPDGKSMPELITYIHDRLEKPVMADVDTVECAIAAAEAGADVVGTTLYGYTEATRDRTPPDFTVLRTMVERLTVPVICEGGIASPAMAKHALAHGAYAVVVGTAITGVDILVQRYMTEIKN